MGAGAHPHIILQLPEGLLVLSVGFQGEAVVKIGIFPAEVGIQRCFVIRRGLRYSVRKAVGLCNFVVHLARVPGIRQGLLVELNGPLVLLLPKALVAFADILARTAA